MSKVINTGNNINQSNEMEKIKNEMEEMRKTLDDVKTLLNKSNENKYKDVIGRKEIDKEIILNSFIFILVLILVKFCIMKVNHKEPFILMPMFNVISFLTGMTIMTLLIMLFIPEKIVNKASKVIGIM